MNILTIGGSGFVSGTLVRTALGRGHRVWAVTRGNRQMPAGVEPVIVDRRDRAAFARAVRATKQHFELVVDCIGYEPDDAQQDIEVFRDRADHFVFISTDFVYDPSRRTVPQRLDNPHLETRLPYGSNKRRCELLLQGSDTGATRWTILRPCHIYGPGSLPGCLPLHGRDGKLLDRLRAGEVLKLVGGGHFLQQPIFAEDLAQVALSCADKPSAHRQTFHVAGPDVIESRRYYQLIAAALGVEARIEEVPVQSYLRQHPEHAPFLCHRVYDTGALSALGLARPRTPIEEGLRRHVAALLSAS